MKINGSVHNKVETDDKVNIKLFKSWGGSFIKRKKTSSNSYNTINTEQKDLCCLLANLHCL